MEEYVRGGKVRSIGVCNFNPHHLAENLDVFNFSLAPEDMAAISALNRNQRSSPANDPENFPW